MAKRNKTRNNRPADFEDREPRIRRVDHGDDDTWNAHRAYELATMEDSDESDFDEFYR